MYQSRKSLIYIPRNLGWRLKVTKRVTKIVIDMNSVFIIVVLMYIRKKQSKNVTTGKVYTYYQIVESRKTEKGSRSAVIAYLGVMDITDDELKTLSILLNHRVKGQGRMIEFSDKIEQLSEQIYLKYLSSTKEQSDETLRAEEFEADAITFKRDKLEIEQNRTVGAELLGMHYWRALKFDQVLTECEFTNKERELARVVILGRLIAPGSERHTLDWFNNKTSLTEFSRALPLKLKKDSLYRICDLIHFHKDKIERGIREHLTSYHGLVDKVYLYDLTNTYFEGNMHKSELCQRGKSKEKRSDCPLVTLALVVDQDGFPVYSRIYKGNQSEPETLKDILKEVFESHADVIDKTVNPSIVMDRGIATKENIAYLREKGYSYFIIERRSQVEGYGEEFADMKSFEHHETASKKPLRLKKIELADRTRVLVFSEGRAEKERSIVSKSEQRFLEDANKLIASNKKGYIKATDKILIRIGRLKEKYGSIAGKHDFQLTKAPDNAGIITEIALQPSGKAPTKSEFPGCYVIETDKRTLTGKQIWDFYMKLSEVEASFRAMKSQLGTRPIYHQKDERIESHLFISVLAYAIMKSILFDLNKADYHLSWTGIIEKMSTYMRATCKITDIYDIIHHIRQTSLPDPETANILNLLKIKHNKQQHYRTNRV